MHVGGLCIEPILQPLHVLGDVVQRQLQIDSSGVGGRHRLAQDTNFEVVGRGILHQQIEPGRAFGNSAAQALDFFIAHGDQALQPRLLRLELPQLRCVPGLARRLPLLESRVPRRDHVAQPGLLRLVLLQLRGVFDFAHPSFGGHGAKASNLILESLARRLPLLESRVPRRDHVAQPGLLRLVLLQLRGVFDFAHPSFGGHGAKASNLILESLARRLPLLESRVPRRDHVAQPGLFGIKMLQLCAKLDLAHRTFVELALEIERHRRSCLKLRAIRFALLLPQHRGKIVGQRHIVDRDDVVDLVRGNRDIAGHRERLAIEHSHDRRWKTSGGSGLRIVARPTQPDVHMLRRHRQTARVPGQRHLPDQRRTFVDTQFVFFRIAQVQRAADLAQRVRLRQPGDQRFSAAHIDHLAGTTRSILVATVLLEAAEDRREQPAAVEHHAIEMDGILLTRQRPAPDDIQVGVQLQHFVVQRAGDVRLLPIQADVVQVQRLFRQRHAAHASVAQDPDHTTAVGLAAPGDVSEPDRESGGIVVTELQRQISAQQAQAAAVGRGHQQNIVDEKRIAHSSIRWHALVAAGAGDSFGRHLDRQRYIRHAVGPVVVAQHSQHDRIHAPVEGIEGLTDGDLLRDTERHEILARQ